jgi:hypothetical protein
VPDGIAIREVGELRLHRLLAILPVRTALLALLKFLSVTTTCASGKQDGKQTTMASYLQDSVRCDGRGPERRA